MLTIQMLIAALPLLLASAPQNLPQNPYVRSVTVSGPVDLDVEFGEPGAVSVDGAAEVQLTKQTLHIKAGPAGGRAQVRVVVSGLLRVDARGESRVNVTGYHGRTLWIRARDTAHIRVRQAPKHQSFMLFLDARDHAQVDTRGPTLTKVDASLAGAARASVGLSTSSGGYISGSVNGSSELSVEGRILRNEVSVAPKANLILR